MGAHDEVDVALCQVFKDFIFIFEVGHQQFQPQSQCFAVGLDVHEMLFGQKFGGRHEGPLGPVVNGGQQGGQGDDGFTAPDIAVQEAVHGPGLFQVFHDVP